MERILREKIIFLILPIVAIVIVIYLLVKGPEQTNVSATVQKMQSVATAQNDLSVKKDRLEILKKQQTAAEEKVEKKKESKSGKVIYDVPGQQFSSEASFGVIFENLLSNMTNSGIRIRSIDYNYHPLDDKILSLNLNGYNACELSFVGIGTYTQFQMFFKNITKEPYLSNIYEVYIEPYDEDKTILITRFKVRLYTRTT